MTDSAVGRRVLVRRNRKKSPKLAAIAQAALYEIGMDPEDVRIVLGLTPAKLQSFGGQSGWVNLPPDEKRKAIDEIKYRNSFICLRTVLDTTKIKVKVANLVDWNRHEPKHKIPAGVVILSPREYEFLACWAKYVHVARWTGPEATMHVADHMRINDAMRWRYRHSIMQKFGSRPERNGRMGEEAEKKFWRKCKVIGLLDVLLNEKQPEGYVKD